MKRLLVVLLAVALITGFCFVSLAQGSAQVSADDPTCRIAFTSYRNGNYPEIYIMNSDGSDQIRLTNGNSVYQNDHDPELSPDGTKIAFVSQDGKIHLMNADGSGVIRLTNNSYGESNPSWSPDGNKIAFSSGLDGNIYVINVNGSGQAQITNGGGTKPCWSPDGTQIAFVSDRDSQPDTPIANIYIANINGSNESRVTDEQSGYMYGISWSPDGSNIVYDSIVPYNPTPGVPDYYSRGLFTIHPDGTNRTALPVTGALQNACVPDWSPDGTKIAFSTTRYPPQEIYVVNADGSGLVKLTSTDNTEGLERGNYQPSWGGLCTSATSTPTPTPTPTPIPTPTPSTWQCFIAPTCYYWTASDDGFIGNCWTVNQKCYLTEIKGKFQPMVTTDIHFYVFQSSNDENGPYDILLKEQVIQVLGNEVATLYSSGDLGNVLLETGKYYAIGACWDGRVFYYYNTSDVPRNWGSASISGNVTRMLDNTNMEPPIIGPTYLGNPRTRTGAYVYQLCFVTPPSEVWVDDDYNTSSCGGHTWGYDAFNKIQDGIDAVSGSTVHVASGTYYENIVLKDGVELLGAGSATTIIDGMQNGSVVTAIGVGNTTVIEGFTITNGSAYHGGGMYNDDSSPAIINCIFQGNQAAGGGGMLNSYSSPIITNCIFWNNSATNTGGGMLNDQSSPTITICTFQNNSATNWGGGMGNWFSSSPIVTNCIFQNNSAVGGGGMSNWYSSSPVITNCTFSNNSATDNGGGMYNEQSSPAITNCILWGDGPDEIYNNSSAPIISYCDVQGALYPGISNINASPMFADAPNGDFHLSVDSPCIDSGNNSASSIPAIDFEGDRRILPVWGTVDMGVDEYVHPTPECDSWDVKYRIVGGQLTMNYSAARLTPVKKTIPFSAGQGGMTLRFCKDVTNGSRIVVIPDDSWYMETFTVDSIMTGVDMDMTIDLDTDAAGVLYIGDGIGDVDVTSESVDGREPVQLDDIGDGTMDAAGSMLIPLTLVGDFNTSIGQDGELPFDMIFTTGNTTNVVSIPANPKMDGAIMVSNGISFEKDGGLAPYVGTNGTITATGTGDCLGIRLVGIRIDFQFELKLRLEPIAVQEPVASHGDANDNGRISAADIAYIKAAILGKWGTPNPGTDGDGDGRITAADIAYVKAYILGRWNGLALYKATYDFLLQAGSNKWARSNSISSIPPALSDNFDTDSDGWVDAGMADYAHISSTNGDVWTISGSEGNYSALQSRFIVVEDPAAITGIGVMLNGSAETHGDILQLWAWNFDTGAWRQIGSNFSMTTDIASYKAWTFWGKVYADYIDGDGYMYILANLTGSNQDMNVDYIKLSVVW